MNGGKGIYILAFLLAIPAVFAACPVQITSTNTVAFLAEVPQINTDLQTCPTSIGKPANSLFGSGNFLINIAMNSGTTRTLTVATSNNQVTGITESIGPAKYTVSITEPNLDAILGSSNKASAAAVAFAQKKVTVRANTFFRRVGWFFVQPFVRSAANKVTPPAPVVAGPSGKPENCDETYMNGWPEYAPNKEKWDGYMAQAKGICQARNSELPRGGNCVQTVQLSRSGTPFYLCWYN